MSDELHEVALTQEETNQILGHCGTDALLVGGQALAFWALSFGVEAPADLGDKVTSDADFIGNRSVAVTLNQYLNWQLWIPEVDDATTQTAKLTKRIGKNGVKQVDFLRSIAGLETNDIRRRAVSVDLPLGATIRILHPVDVLESRLKNLLLLPSKQNPVGAAQAQLAITIVERFLETLLSANRRQLLAWIERIVALALDKALGDVFDRYQLEPLRAIPADKVDVPNFKSKRWPQIQALAAANRRKVADRKERESRRLGLKDQRT